MKARVIAGLACAGAPVGPTRRRRSNGIGCKWVTVFPVGTCGCSVHSVRSPSVGTWWVIDTFFTFHWTGIRIFLYSWYVDKCKLFCMRCVPIIIVTWIEEKNCYCLMKFKKIQFLLKTKVSNFKITSNQELLLCHLYCLGSSPQQHWS